jgi:hypothetical protein
MYRRFLWRKRPTTKQAFCALAHKNALKTAYAHDYKYSIKLTWPYGFVCTRQNHPK